MTFKSRSVKRTGPQSADILGDLTMHGVTIIDHASCELLTPASDTTGRGVGNDRAHYTNATLT